MTIDDTRRAARLMIMTIATVFSPASLLSAPAAHAQSAIDAAFGAAVAVAPGDDAGLARPAWATTRRFRGRVAASTPVTVQIHLPLRDLAAAKAELEEISDPDNPRYGQYLSSEQFESKYSPSAGDVAAVSAYLESQHLKIVDVPRNRLFVTATGSAATAERVFATTLGYFEIQPGQLRRAPMVPALIPAAIRAKVSAVAGLATRSAKRISATERITCEA